ncbi:PQQ-binding-like beta-propeller repeat protein [Saccharibacillus sacchari]|uniref:PQQ-binding-like beta-propeller repeat protein n=1 Tax=Saccharibacillus sacchari TaxID=456493 RepID=A0ACC6PHB5_9BACL
MNTRRKITSLFLVIGLTSSMLSAVSAAPVTSYSAPTLSETNTIQALKPLWSVEKDPVDQAFSAVASGNTVIYVHEGKLRGINAATGKTQWSSSSLPSSEWVKGNGTLYFIDQKGILISLNPKTGKPLWKTNTGMSASNPSFTISLINGTLYVGGPFTLQAYNPVNGKRLWKQKTESEYGGPAIQGLYDGVLVASMTVSGALTVDQYSGYNPKTGKKLWESGGNNGPVLASRNGYLYVRDQYPMSSPDHALVLNKINIKTGKATKHYEYVQVQDGMFQTANEVFVDGDDLYIAMRKYSEGTLEGFSSMLYRFKLDQDPDKQTPVIYEGKGDFLAGPYLNRFFVQKDLQFKSIALNGKTSASYDIPLNPVSRLDLIENNAYVGMSDGKFYPIDIPSGKTLGVVDTDSRIYGQTLIVGSTILIQAEGKLIAVKRPAVSKKTS